MSYFDHEAHIPWIKFTPLALVGSTQHATDGNFSFKSSNVFGIRDQSAIQISGKYSVIIDRTSFFECTLVTQTLQYSGACVKFQYSGKNGIIISRTIVSGCYAYNSPSFHISEPNSKEGWQELSLVSIDKSPGEAKSVDIFHTLSLSNGIQKVSNLNNTRCHTTRHYAPSLYESRLATISYMNIADNVGKQCCCFSAGGFAIVKRSNFIRNTEGSPSIAPNMRGIVMVRGVGVLNVYDSVVLDNVYTDYLVYGNEGTASFVGCMLQSLQYGVTNGASISFESHQNRQIVTMTLFASRDIHAGIPYRDYHTHLHNSVTALMKNVILLLCLTKL